MVLYLAYPENMVPEGHKKSVFAQHNIAWTWYDVLYLIADLQKDNDTGTNKNEGGSFICVVF
jgi:hypothetical protein